MTADDLMMPAEPDQRDATIKRLRNLLWRWSTCPAEAGDYFTAVYAPQRLREETLEEVARD